MKYFLNQNIFTASPYTAAISQGVIRLIEKGVVARLKKKWWEEQRGGGSCKVGEQITRRKHVSLRFLILRENSFQL